MEYNKTLLSLAIILAFLSGLALGYTLGSKSMPIPKTINLQNNNSNSQNSIKPIERDMVRSDLTANEAMEFADRDALAWANDSYISEISLFSKDFAPDGKSNGWKFTYYSKSKEKLFEVVVKDGESRGGEEKASEIAHQTIKSGLIDSPVLAKTFFSSNAADTQVTSLVMRYEPSEKIFMWFIFSEKGSYTMDAEI